jgi:hypothetical protein
MVSEICQAFIFIFFASCFIASMPAGRKQIKTAPPDYPVGLFIRISQALCRIR